MEDWKAQIVEKISKLMADRERIITLDRKLRWDNLVSEQDCAAFQAAVDSIDQQVEGLKFELLLDEMLESDLPLEEFLKKYDIKH